MAYTEKVLDHYINPRNVGSFKKDEPNVGTGIVGAPECGDVMKLQIKVGKKKVWSTHCLDCKAVARLPIDLDAITGNGTIEMSRYDMVELRCKSCESVNVECKASEEEVIEDAKFKTFGCGSAIASSSYLTEMVKGKTTKEAMQIKNTFIVKELSLPPVKIHCSVLAEDAIKAALEDWNKKKTEGKPEETKV